MVRGINDQMVRLKGGGNGCEGKKQYGTGLGASASQSKWERLCGEDGLTHGVGVKLGDASHVHGKSLPCFRQFGARSGVAVAGDDRGATLRGALEPQHDHPHFRGHDRGPR